jgi:hypothetical protein
VLATALWALPCAWTQVLAPLQCDDPADLGSGALIAAPYLSPRRTVDRPAVMGSGTIVRGGLMEEYIGNLALGTGAEVRYTGQIRRLEAATDLGSRWHLALRRDRSRIGARVTGIELAVAEHATEAWSASVGYRPSAKWSVGAALTTASESGSIELSETSTDWSLRPRGWTVEAERRSGGRSVGLRASHSSGPMRFSATASGVGAATRLRAEYGLVDLRSMGADGDHARGWLARYHTIAQVTSDLADEVGGSRGRLDPSLQSAALLSFHRERRGRTTLTREMGGGWVWTRGGADVRLLPLPEVFGGHYIANGTLGGPWLHAAAGFRSEVHKRVAFTGGLRADLCLLRGRLRAIEVATVSRPASVLWDEDLGGRLAYSVLPAAGLAYHTDSWDVTYSVGWPIAGLTPRPGQQARPLPLDLRLPATHALVVQYGF